MLRAIVVGTGQMGTAVADELESRGHEVVSKIGSQGAADGKSLIESIAENECDVAIEFSLPHAAEENVATLLNSGITVVSGTTGWKPESLEQVATKNGVSLLHSANFSIGVAVMKKVAALMARSFAPFPDFEPAMVERHHNRKKDAPSGTAKMLAEVVQSNSEVTEFPVTSLRQGQIAGEHTLIFEGEAESLEVVHRAHSRRIFAVGAVRAAEWIAQEETNGLVSFETFLERNLKWPANV